jgi:uncharacterized protein (TIGR03086 family)
MASDLIDLLAQGYDWTEARLARVQPDDLDMATPCEGWQLRHLLDHMLDSLDRLAAAAEGEVADADQLDPQHQARSDRLGDDCGRTTFAAVKQRALTAWRQPDVMARTCELPLGTLPAPVAANINLVEVVVHGWDVSQTTGEAAAIPPELAEPILAFSRPTVAAARGTAFGPDLETGDTASERLVSFLGRKP